MSSSPSKSPSQASTVSPEKHSERFSGEQLFLGLSPVSAGTMNDAAVVRSVIVDAMKNCPKSRAIIADEMSHLTGTKVTERMLNGFAADSREDSRFPIELQRAFCFAVGDNRLLTCGAVAAGLHVIDEVGFNLLEIGRKYLLRKRSNEALASLERRMDGVDL